MAESLKSRYGPEIPARIARMISRAYPAFPRRAFLRDALDGYEALELMSRGRHISAALRKHLPESVSHALKILLNSVEPPQSDADASGLAPFLYLPYTCFVADYALEHFTAAMRAQHALTQRFTAEFSIRPFIEKYPQRTWAQLRAWATDPSPHVRRLVSEGTRPRLPWAPRLRVWQRTPELTLELLELLKDDPAAYVRRSVANHLNDIGKDHPRLLVATAKRWLKDAGAERAWIVRHALRSAIKRGDPGALGVIGYAAAAEVGIRGVRMTPRRARIGAEVTIAINLANKTANAQHVLADLRVHFVKANGKTRPKVFKLKSFELAPGGSIRLGKTLSLANLTTRRHYPGAHRVELLLNGRARPLGAFTLSGPVNAARARPNRLPRD